MDGHKSSKLPYLELFRLLLQVAWADEEVRPEEMQHFLAEASNWLDAEEINRLEGYLVEREKLPPANLKALRPHRERVLFMARRLIAADGLAHADERDVLQTLEELLPPE